jgi:hypothetical protein
MCVYTCSTIYDSKRLEIFKVIIKGFFLHIGILYSGEKYRRNSPFLSEMERSPEYVIKRDKKKIEDVKQCTSFAVCM